MTVTCEQREVGTPVGPAQVHLHTPPGAVGLLLLGHGAGGGLDAVDLRAVRDAGLHAGLAVGLVEQPWRVAGRRVAEAVPRLDAAWLAVARAVPHAGPLLVGGRSSGARVACRTARELGAAGVVALAFPLVTPRGVSRLAELRAPAPAVPRLVVQGARDAFGVPEPEAGMTLHLVAGADHAFRTRRQDARSADDVAREVRDVAARWLAQTLT